MYLGFSKKMACSVVEWYTPDETPLAFRVCASLICLGSSAFDPFSYVNIRTSCQRGCKESGHAWYSGSCWWSLWCHLRALMTWETWLLPIDKSWMISPVLAIYYLEKSASRSIIIVTDYCTFSWLTSCFKNSEAFAAVMGCTGIPKNAGFSDWYWTQNHS